MNENKVSSITTLFTLLVFLLFTVLSLLIVLIGAKSYRGIVTGMESNQQTRTALSYVTNKVHAAGTGETALRTVGGRQAIVISSRYNEQDYKTYIYEYDGAILEWFTRADRAFQAGSGDTITAVSGFSAKQEGGLLRLTARGKDGKEFTVSVLLS